VGVDLEALFQIDGSTRETFEGRRAWAAANLQGRNEDAFYRPYDRYVAWGDMRVDRELARALVRRVAGRFRRGATSAFKRWASTSSPRRSPSGLSALSAFG
jgi:hypothetical protein